VIAGLKHSVLFIIVAIIVTLCVIDRSYRSKTKNENGSSACGKRKEEPRNGNWRHVIVADYDGMWGIVQVYLVPTGIG
jgi:hypothetical protein